MGKKMKHKDWCIGGEKGPCNCGEKMKAKQNWKCLRCGYIGPMKTHLSYAGPAIIAFVGLLLWIVPGILYMIWRGGKRRCPKCNSINMAMEMDRVGGG